MSTMAVWDPTACDTVPVREPETRTDAAEDRLRGILGRGAEVLERAGRAVVLWDDLLCVVARASTAFAAELYASNPSQTVYDEHGTLCPRTADEAALHLEDAAVVLGAVEGETVLVRGEYQIKAADLRLWAAQLRIGALYRFTANRVHVIGTDLADLAAAMRREAEGL